MSVTIDLGHRPTLHAEDTIRDGKSTTQGKGLGRLAAPDPRDGLFRFALIRKQLGPEPPPRTFRNWNIDAKRLPIDQGPKPWCVGYSIATAAAVGPHTQSKVIRTRENVEAFANRTYIRALDLDEWDGNDPNYGTSVRAGMKAARDEGLITAFAWGESVADAAAFVRDFGPAVAGTIWPDTMMATDANGYLNVGPNFTLTGAHAAGHAYCLAQVNFQTRNPDGSKGRFVIPQTWGTGWGYKGSGRAFMSFNTFAQLLIAGGEVCFPTEVDLKPAGG